MEQNTLKIRLKKFLKSERISNTEFANMSTRIELSTPAMNILRV